MITTDEFIERYYAWLIEQAFATPVRRKMYDGVLKVLFDIPFYWTMMMDSNRAGDVQCYRRYERHMLDQEEHNISAEWLDLWENAMPSVLEVLIGIAERWSQAYDEPTPYYFNHLFQNMGFHNFRGPLLRPSQEEAVRWTVDNWLNRQIERSGDGSPFPIKPSRNGVDMRTTDIWGQMNAYSLEHFM